jgi:hypothetical protein
VKVSDSGPDTESNLYLTKTLCVFVTEGNRLMLFRDIIGAGCEHRAYKYTLCVQ